GLWLALARRMGFIQRMSACRLPLLIFIFLLSSFTAFTRAEDVESTAKLLLSGRYESVVDIANKAINNKEREEEWRLYLMKAQLALGRYPDALAAATNALRRYSSSIRIKLTAYEALQASGQSASAKELLDEMNEVASSRYRSYREPEEVVALGSAAVLLGADPKLVLDNFYEPAKKANPKLRDAYLAAGELALEKQDFALAGKYFTQGLKQHPNDPDMHFGMARAFAPDDRAQMVKSLQTVFEQNPRHVPALLLLVDHLIDSEAYKDAEEKLAKIEETNPNHPELWAYR